MVYKCASSKRSTHLQFTSFALSVISNEPSARLAQLRLKILTATSIKMTVYWDVVPCSLVEIDRRFRGACCLSHQGDRRYLSVTKGTTERSLSTLRSVEKYVRITTGEDLLNELIHTQKSTFQMMK
jgi:hypothetical protein